VAPVTILEDPIVVGKRCWPPVDVAFIIGTRLTPNVGGVLNGVTKERVIVLDVVVGSVEVVVIEFERVPLGFDQRRLPQEVGLLVIRMIPESS
jgi:hypothetical protein